jgi:hypothetical protein
MASETARGNRFHHPGRTFSARKARVAGRVASCDGM